MSCVCVYIYIYIPIPHVTSHPITYLSYLLYTPILVMSCISCLHWQCLMMTWHYLLPLLTLNPKIYSLIGIKNKFLFRLPWNMEGMFFIYLFIFIILVSALKNESRETHAKNSSCCPLPGLYGWLGSYCSFSRKLPPLPPIRAFYYSPFSFCPPLYP
jgi:hypothetical protein